ncbi:Helix-turn-helix Psq [Macrophomina phaseolina MS6]|uniref:Helix-turn-helix Psq n=1 Tax=Macrophomina phaseolina (strain MS6) TaxID=1126212 RepID=K2RXG7_MACPH|nr:Helix-turn-helix Psq [Macrophomina phaseolina MS6]
MATQARWPLSTAMRLFYLQHQIPPPRKMESTRYEARINLALEALQENRNLSVRAAAKIYNVQRSTLQNRRVGKLARRDIPANSRKLTDLEEKAVIEHIVELSTRSFSA